MKNLVKLIIFLLSLQVLTGQSLSVFDVDASNFPTIKANFFAFDKDGKQLTNLNPSDFEVKENGLPRTVTDVSCPSPQPLQKVSIAMSIDVSGSMLYGKFGEIPAELGKTTAKVLSNQVDMPPSEFALQICHYQAYIIQDFTTNKSKLLSEIEQIKSTSGANNFVEHLLNRLTGLVNIAKTGKNKRIAVIYTDAWGNALSSEELQQCKDTCSKYDITFFAVIYSRPVSLLNQFVNSLQELADFTGGFLYDGVTSTAAAEDIGLKLQQTVQGGEPCKLEWQSDAFCHSGINNVEINLIKNQTKATGSYQRPFNKIAMLEFNPDYVKFLDEEIGVKAEEKVTVTARNADFNVTNITSNNATFEILPNSFSLKSGQSLELTVSYLPSDSGYVFASFDIENDICLANYIATGGFSGIKPKIKTIKILHPNGGEVFVAGSDTIITWQGIPAIDTVQLEYTVDNGATWKTITDKANGLHYIWKNIPKPTSSQCKVRIKQGIMPSDNENNGKLIHTLSGHNNEVYVVSWSSDGSRVATASWDSTAKIWDSETGALLYTLSDHNGAIYDVSWNPDGSRVATASLDGTVRIWDAETGIAIHTLSGHTSYVWVVKWSPDGTRVATASEDKTAKIWDTETGNILHTLIGLDHVIVIDVSWNPDGSRLAIASLHKTARIWDAETGISLHWLNGHTGSISKIIWSPDGSRVATASSDGTARIWDATSGLTLHTLSGHSGSVSDVSWSPDGFRIATSSIDNTAKIWDSETGILLNTLIGHYDDIYKVNWSPDGVWIATSSADNRARIWDATSGFTVNTLSGHTGRVWDVSWNPDGSRVATASRDKTAKIWDAVGFDVLQEDESDSVFSIVEPLPLALDIDMLQCLIGSSKDSVVVEFIQNVGSWKFRVDSIYFQGADANAFSLVSGFPTYIVEASQNHFAEFRFTPNRVGIHSAEIVIITQADTLVRNIIGEGIENRLIIMNDLIDFGKVGVGEFKDSIQTATIKYIGNSSITINETKHNYPNDIDFTTLSGGGSFTLQPNEIYKMDLRFAPSSIGRTSGTLEFHYDGVGSPAVIQLYGQGVGGLIKIDNDSAYAGEKRMLKLRLGNNIKPKSDDLITGFHAKISYNPTLLSCPYENVTQNFNLLKEIIVIQGKWDGKNDLLSEFEVVAALGNADSTELEIEEFYWLDEDNNLIDFEVEKQNGTFTLLGICYEGGTRLLNPYSKAGITSISPNPAENIINIELSLSEFGVTELSLYNLLGEKVSTIFSESVSQKSIIELNSDISKIGSGQYLLIFRSPTYTETRQLLILR